MLGPLFSGRRESQDLRLRNRAHRHHIRHGWTTFRERPRLIEHGGRQLVGFLEILSALDQEAVLGALSRADHDRRRRRDAERAGTCDDQDRDEEHEGVRDRLAERDGPEEERENADSNHRWNEHGRHAIREALNRRAGSLGILHELDDLVQGRVRSDARRTEPQQPGPVDGGADRGVTDLLFHRDRLPRDHRLVNGGEPPDNHPVDGDALPWPDDDQVVHLDELYGNLLLVVVPDYAGGPRGEVHQLPNRVARLAFRNLLEVLAKEDEANDDRRGVVVRPLLHERDADEREKRYDGAVSKRSTRANGDEDIHVRALVPDGVEEAAVEAISCDELHRRGEDEEHKVHRFL